MVRPLLLALMAVAPAALAQEVDGRLVGLVLEQGTGAPLGGMVVRAAGREMRTDGWGAFALELPPGEHEVEVLGPDGRARSAGRLVVRGGYETEILVGWGPAALVVQVEAPADDVVSPVDEAARLGTVAGRIVSEEGGAPIAGARVVVRGRASTVTDAEGRFVLELPEGTWDLAVVARSFASRTVAGVTSVVGETTALDLALVPAGLALDDVVVAAPRVTGSTAALLDERRTATAVADVVGAEQMSRAGDTNAAAALRRVTGLTVVGGRYAYVRGLGDRYAATLLNGQTLPSPEPERRVVPLDMFPASMLDSIVIQKTPSPDVPAEFGGGIVQIRTRSVPEERIFEIGSSIGYRHGTTWRVAETGARGATDFLGFGQGFRALPELIRTQAAGEPIKAGGRFSDGGFDDAELEAFGEAIANRWDLFPTRLTPDGSAQVSWGDSVSTAGGVRLGALAGGNWSNGWQFDEAFRRVYSVESGDRVVLKRDTQYRSAQNRIQLGSMLALGAAWEGGASLDATTLVNRISEYEALRFDSEDPTGADGTRSTRISWLEQQFVQQQLRGHHPLSGEGGPVLDWRYAVAQARRNEPDRREYRYLSVDGGYVLSQRGTWNEVAYVDLSDRTHDGGIDLTLPVLHGRAARPGAVKLGAAAVERRRSSATRRFSYELHGHEGIDLSRPIGEVLVPENIGRPKDGSGGYVQLYEQTQNSDDYLASQHLQAGYGMVDLPLLRRLRLMSGARVERSDQSVRTYQLFSATDDAVRADLVTTDLLPSSLLTLAVGPDGSEEDVLLRASYGRTVSRPEFRELSQVPFQDFRTGVLYFGEPGLERALIDHVDLRWEWYPRPGETVSAAAFYKHFTSPIESVTAASAVSGLAATFANATAADSVGLEVELRLLGDRVSERLRDVYVGGNAAVIQSRIDTSNARGADTSPVRPLQGQAPWVVNAQLGYDDPERGLDAAILYNVFGPRLMDVGQQGVPDTYDMPVHRLDAVLNARLGPRTTARLLVSNVLDWPTRTMTGGEVAEQNRDGFRVLGGIRWQL